MDETSNYLFLGLGALTMFLTTLDEWIRRTLLAEEGVPFRVPVLKLVPDIVTYLVLGMGQASKHPINIK